jgi:hypothetical protein
MKSWLFKHASISDWPLISQLESLLDAHPVSLFWPTLVIAGLFFSIPRYEGFRHSTKTPVFKKDTANDISRIEQIRYFDLSSTKPPVFRPFKPKYHLTMGMIQSAEYRLPESR